MATERDASGVYRKALAAVITAFTGVTDLYSRPLSRQSSCRRTVGPSKRGLSPSSCWENAGPTHDRLSRFRDREEGNGRAARRANQTREAVVVDHG